MLFVRGGEEQPIVYDGEVARQRASRAGANVFDELSALRCSIRFPQLMTPRSVVGPEVNMPAKPGEIARLRGLFADANIFDELCATLCVDAPEL